MNDRKKDFIAGILAIVIILLVILLILVSYAVVNLKKNTKSDNVEVYTVNSSFDSSNFDSVSTISKVDVTKDFVYEEKCNYELNFDGVKFDINSVMPVININKENIKLINNEIKNYYENIKNSEELYELTYNTYLYNDILSVIIQKTEKRSDNIKNISNVLVYNIDTNTGNIVSNRELIEIKRTTLEKVCLELMNTINKDLKNNYNFNIADSKFLIDGKKTSEDYIKEEIYIKKDDELGNTLKMYINSQGKISICFYVPILNTNEKYTYNTFIVNI